MQIRDRLPEMPEQLSNAEPHQGLDCGIGTFLFLATAAIVVWQNSRLGVLWDLSFILEYSHRISVGDVPYRDFPFPYAPLTFLAQAGIIKLTGPVFWHHTVYCAVVGGLGTVLTWRILLNQLRDAISSARLVAFLLAVPLTILGIYSIYPHPFYDPDCTFVILICILLLQRLEQLRFPALPSFFTGALLVVPLFFKQNTGIAFLASAMLALAGLIVIERGRQRPIGSYLLLIAGAALALAFALLLIHFVAGLGNYHQWTFRFAAARRFPPFKDMIAIYRDPALLWWFVAFAAGVLVLWLARPRSRLLVVVAGALMSAPFIWSMIYLLLDQDRSGRAERLVAVWPLLLIVSLMLALLTLRRHSGVALILPFILIGTVHGAFLSQQLWGSTYALWPLLMLLLAGNFTALVGLLRQRFDRALIPLSTLLTLSLLVSGAFYLHSNARLAYADLSKGNLHHSGLPALQGLSVRGSWIPEFEELVRYADRNIPREDGILMLPGEDLFYYATGRRPRFPVLMFDHTINPYSPEEIVVQVHARDIRWLIIKDAIQLQGQPLEKKEHLFELLRQEFKRVDSLSNYEIYSRMMPGEKDNEQDDDRDQNDGDSSWP